MRRRRLLARLASGGLAGTALAGCISRTAPIDEPRSAELPCPPFEDAARTTCYGRTEEGQLWMVPGRQRATLPTADLSFRLENRSWRTVLGGPSDWSLDKFVDGEWYHVLPFVRSLWPLSLQPGETHTWRMYVDNTVLGSGAEARWFRDNYHLAGLGPGVYSFSAWGSYDPDNTERVASAPFRLLGDPPDLVPSPAYGDARRAGDAVVHEADGDAHGIEVVRAGEAADADRWLLEQVYRWPGLRNALALFEPGVQRVRLAGEEGLLLPPEVEDGGTLRFRGDVYRVR